MTALATFAVDPVDLDIQGGQLFDPAMTPFCFRNFWACFMPTLPWAPDSPQPWIWVDR